MGPVTFTDYMSPFDDGAASTANPSIFPAMLGDASTSPTYIHTSIQGLNWAQQIITTITDLANDFKGQVSTMSGSIGQAVDAADTFAGQLEGFDQQFYDLYSQSFPILDTITKAMTGFFAGLLALSIVGIVATILTALCKCYKMRYLIYFSCCILFVIAIFCFILAMLTSVLTPVIYFSCDFLEYSISGADEFESTHFVISYRQFRRPDARSRDDDLLHSLSAWGVRRFPRFGLRWRLHCRAVGPS